MLFRFSLYGFLKNQRYFEPFLVLAFLEQGLNFFTIGLLIACRDATVNILEIPSGAIADAFGRRGSMMFSFAAYIASFLVFGFSLHWSMFFLAMFLFGIGDSFRTGTHKAMIFEWLRLNDRTAERTKVYGFTRSWSKFGSATSGILAAIFVVLTDNYRAIFLFAVIPYLLNLVNFAGYPKELDGEHEKAKSIRTTATRLGVALKQSLKNSNMRRLITESMGWDGIFQATRDYLQPVIQTIVVGWVAHRLFTTALLSETQQTAIMIGPVYAILSLLSGIASRSAFRLENAAGSAERATRWLWAGNVILYLTLYISGFYSITIVVGLAMITMHILQNVWRPILISRFDDHGTADQGATILSIESQAQRICTMVAAPLIGLLIDLVAKNEIGGYFWPIGLVGGVCAAYFFFTARSKPATQNLTSQEPASDNR